MASGSRHSLYMVAEATYGITPATPSMSAVRLNSTNIGLAKNTLQSEELRSNRQIAGFRHGTEQTGGDISVEVSYGSFDEILEAVLCGTWATDVLKAGTTRRSFSLLRHFADITDKPYHLINGVEFNTMKLSINTENIVTMTFGTVGKTLSISATVPTGATLGTPGTTQAMDGLTGVIKEGGTTIAVVTEVELTLENGIEPRFVIGSKNTIRPSIKQSIVTGQITAFFESSTLLEKFLKESSSSLEFEIGDTVNKYNFKIPNLKYTGGQPDVQGAGDIPLSMPFQALYSSADGSQIIITRGLV